MINILLGLLFLGFMGFGLVLLNQMVTDFQMYWNKGLLTDDDIKNFILKGTDKHIYDLIYNKSQSGKNNSKQFKLYYKSDVSKNKVNITIEPN
tara:strand:+ start:5521 stop:5799 length:279 start_codon:yes stop_codon:yes gene_type:complete